MKILGVAHQRGEVMAAVTALHGLPPEASVTWASSFKDAARWIRDNEDLAVLLLDAQVGSELCASFLTHLRGVGVTAPAIVVTSGGTATSVEALGFGPNDTVLTRGTLLHELPTALLCAIGDALQKRLQEAALELEAAEQRHAADTATVAAQLADRQALDQKLTSLDRALRCAEELRASDAVASAALAQRSAELSASLEQARRDRESTALAVERLARREAELAGALGVAASVRETLELKIADADSALARAETRATRERLASAQRQGDLEQRLAHREHELDAQIAEALAAREGLNRQLVDSQTALETAQERAALERQDATEQAARREAELHERISREIDQRRGMEKALARMERARQEAAAQQASVIASLNERKAGLETELAQAAAAQDALQQRVRDAEATGERAREDRTTAAAEVERLLRLETELRTQLAEGATASDMLARRLADAERARQDADEAATQDRLAARDRQTELEARVAQELDQRRAVETRLADAAIARQDTEQQHASEMSAAAAGFAERHAQDEARLTAATAAAAERLAHLEQELGARLADVTVARDELGRQLAETKSTLEAAHEHAVREQQAATDQALRRETELQEVRARLDEITATLAAVHERTARERQEAIEQHGSAIASLTAQLTEKRARFETDLADAVAAQNALQQRLHDAEAAGERARQDQTTAAAEVERLLRLESELEARLTAVAAAAAEQLAHVEQELGARLADVSVARDELGRQLAETKSTLEAAHEHAVRERQEAIAQHGSAIASLTAQLAEMRARFETQLADAVAARDALQQQLQDAEVIGERVRQDHAMAAAEVERLLRLETELNAQLADVTTTRDTLSRQLADAHRARQDADAAATQERLAATDRQVGLEARLAGELDQRQAVEERLADEVVARRDAEARYASEMATVVAQFQELQATLRSAVTAHACEVERLQKQLGDSRAEMHRQFDQHPLPMCQCTREGVLTRANRAFADLVGCPTADPRRVLEVATTLFAASSDLSWLIGRGLTPEAEDAIEATWKNVHGGRLVVRLSAMATLNRILIVAQDITSHHVLQDTLTRTRRMEAVGRLASEVAVTCGNLLGDVSRDGERWLATLDGSAGHLNRGRLLLGDVARAASFLRQLDAYAEEQVGALEPVDLRRALRDLEPVLKEVAGDDIELVLPKRTLRRAPTFYVDLKVERVERLLVNVASYARERMRLGGSMIFDLAPAQVDREFVDKYPSVRPGAHVLLTVTEARAARPVGPIGVRQELVEANDASTSERPGVDLGALHNLVRASGGHLWMEAEPPGDMVIKIHLPLREQDDRSWSAANLARAAMRVAGARR